MKISICCRLYEFDNSVFVSIFLIIDKNTTFAHICQWFANALFGIS